ncbi:MAG: erythromycin esterase family protein, partial [Candidatus Eisenbacteria sp.]|nr:erythromycin esterase family protein [Candidatus Eisenbacteria bacterium]
GYEAVVDTTTAMSGENSVRIRYESGEGFGVATSTFPLDSSLGRKVLYTGYIKTEGVTDGYAGLWWRVDGPGQRNMLAFDNMQDRGATGTTDWTRYEIELSVDTLAVNVNFGVLLTGKGTAWFDALEVELDEEAYKDSLGPKFVPGEEQLAWMRASAIPLDTDDPSAPHDDLAPLRELVGDARIVALGEGTHGTREFFRMKHRLTEFLASEMGFTVFAIEANMPEARRVNDYVLRGEGESKEALAGLYFWTWNTEEVLAMIEWMREFNEEGKGRMEFWGFDVQTPTVAMEDVESFIEVAEPEYLDSLREEFDRVRDTFLAARTTRERTAEFYGPWHESATRVLEHLQENRERYLASFDVMTVDWAIQNARVVRQGADMWMEDGRSRDESMADNVDWILAHTPPGTKIVLWAHNGHVSRGAAYGSMGSVLSERHGDDMSVFGFAFHEGEYTAVGKDGLGTYGTSPSEAGSVEWALHQSGLAPMVLDLSVVSTESVQSGWLAGELDFRSIGAVAVEYAFRPGVVTDMFDALVFFDKSHPSRSLPRAGSPPRERKEGEGE